MIDKISTFVNSNRQEIIKCLKLLVDQKGGSENRTAVNKVGSILSDEILKLNFSLFTFKEEQFGNHLLFENHNCDQAITLSGHMDTTFTSYLHLPDFHIEGEKAIGPGTGDMLGGLVVFLYAIKCLNHLGYLDKIPITLFFNTDEERGSPTSKPVFQDLIKKTAYTMISETAGANNEIVVGRRGKLSFDILVKGREGHAGNFKGNKSSAVEEVAHKILAIEALNGYWPETDLNAGKVRGGIAGNTIAGESVLSTDIRYSCTEHEADIKAKIIEIVEKNYVQGCFSELKITSERPLWPLKKKGIGINLCSVVEKSAIELGQSFGTELRKGTSDANFFGAQGVDVIDGMGPIGFHDHTDQEYILIDTLFERIRLCTLTLCKLESALINASQSPQDR